MTLIATAISRYGIIQAASARLTSYPEHATPGRRVFRLSFANAMLSITGGYEIDGTPLDQWVDDGVATYLGSAPHPALGGFADSLRERLTPQQDPLHRRILHLSGYEEEEDGGGTHPAHYFIRNFRGATADGDYSKPGREFLVTEEFWSRDFRDEQTVDTIATGGAHLYFDGFPERRLSYLVLNRRVLDLYRQMWSSSEQFRAPRSLEDLATLVELDMRLTLAFLGQDGGRDASGLGAGDLELELIAAPANAAAPPSRLPRGAKAPRQTPLEPGLRRVSSRPAAAARTARPRSSA